MYVTVTATEDLTESDVLLLELGTYYFEEDYSDSAPEEEASNYLTAIAAILSVLTYVSI